MALQTLTVNGNSVVAVPIPSVGAAKVLEFSISDAIALVSGAYTKETQAFAWPGADEWSIKGTLPPLRTDTESRPWVSWLMQMRGMLRATLICDPTYRGPQGYLVGSVPVIDSSGGETNLASATRMYLKGFAPNTDGVLRAGDRLQSGYRLHQVLEDVNSDANGKANFEIWPSQRETPADGAAVIFDNPQGLFRLSANVRNWSSDTTQMSAISFSLVEYRGGGNS
jgi:hypothetical protein